MESKRAIITITDNVDPTSMEYNEFVLYRASSFPWEEHYIFSLYRVENSFHQEAKTFTNVRLFDAENSYLKLRHKLASVLRDINRQHIPLLVHFNNPRPALCAHILNLLFLRNIPTLYTIHSSFKFYSLGSKILTLANFFLAKHLNFVSHAGFASFPRLLTKIKNKKLHIIPNGVDIDRINNFLALHKKSSSKQLHNNTLVSKTASFKLINIGRLVEAKNQSWLIRLMSQLPHSVTLTIIGDGYLRNDLEKIASAVGRHRFRFTGAIPREAVYEELLNADLFVSCSTREGMPIAVLEAMALSRPTILSDIDPHREIGVHGTSAGVTPLNVDEWIRRIMMFMSLSRDDCERIGEENRKIVEKHFSLKKMHVQYTELYNKLWRL